MAGSKHLQEGQAFQWTQLALVVLLPHLQVHTWKLTGKVSAGC
jgi:hypothetical protein